MLDETIYCPNPQKQEDWKFRYKARCIGCDLAKECQYREDVMKQIESRKQQKINMEEFVLTKEELLEFAKVITFHLDDKLCPLSRENLRAEAWLMGYQFAKTHQKPKCNEIVLAEDATQPSGSFLITQERNRQIMVEGYNAEHDRHHKPETLAKAALAYLTYDNGMPNASKIAYSYWPWEKELFKPRAMKRNLIKAGALIAAAIDRISNAEKERS